MARFKFILLVMLGVAACAPSPLYVGQPRVGTGGEAPRDGRGEPMWGAIRPAPVDPAPPVMPAKPGLPVLPPA